MRNLKTLFAIGLSTTVLAGCITEDEQLEGITFAGGNAVKYNTALQVIDPWPNNVHETHLITPSDRLGDKVPIPTTALPVVAAPETSEAPVEPAT